MKIRDRVATWLAKAAFGIFSDEDAGGEFLNFLFPSRSSTPPKRGTREILRAYSEHPWLRAIESKIAQAIAMLEWELFATGAPLSERMLHRKWYQDRKLQRNPNWQLRQKRFRRHKQAGELVEIDDHPLLDSLNDGNIFLTGNSVWKVTQTHIDLAGEAFWLKSRNLATGLPEQYFPLPPWWVIDTPSPNDPSYDIRFPNMGTTERIPDTEILWMIDPDAEAPYRRGSGLAQAMGDELDTYEFASRHVKQFFFNDARPPILISGRSLRDDTVRKRLQQEWLQKHGGFQRAWKPAFLGDDITVKSLGQSFNDMNILELMKHARDVFVSVYGVPPEMFGIIENSNRATIEAAEFLFAKHVILPRAEFLRSWLQTCLVPEFDERLILEFVSPVQEDKLHKLNVMKAAPWSFRVDEWREAGSEEPLPDGEGDVFLVPVALLPVTAPEEGGGSEHLEPEEERALLPPGQGNGVIAVTRYSELNRIRFNYDQNGVDREAQKGRFTDVNADDPFWRIVQRISDQLEPEVRASFIREITSWSRQINVADLAGRIAARGGAAIDQLPWDDLSRALVEALRGSIEATVGASMELGSAQLSSILNVTFSADVSTSLAQAFIQGQTANFVREITESTRQAIRDFVSEAVTEGRSIPQTAAKVRGKVGLLSSQIRTVERFEDKLREQGRPEEEIRRRVAAQERAQLRRRALVISRTETIRAGNMGQQLTWQEAAAQGFLDRATARRIWIVTPDDRLDTIICEPMEGQTVGLDEQFQTPEGQLVLTPPAHPQCRCAVSLEFVDRRGVTQRITPVWLIKFAVEAAAWDLDEELEIAA